MREKLKKQGWYLLRPSVLDGWKLHPLPAFVGSPFPHGRQEFDWQFTESLQEGILSRFLAILKCFGFEAAVLKGTGNNEYAANGFC